MDGDRGKTDSNIASEKADKSSLNNPALLKRNEPSRLLRTPVQVASPGDSILLGNSMKATESTDIDIDEMNAKLHDIHKEQKEGWSEKEGNGNASHQGTLDPKENEIYKKAKKCVPRYIVDINYICLLEMAKLLNVERADSNDFRLIAANLGFHTSFINIVKEAKDPMMSIFESATRIYGEKLVDALLMCRRFDVMDKIVGFYLKAQLRQSISHEEKRAQFQTSAPLAGSVEEALLNADRGRASSDPVEQVSDCFLDRPLEDPEDTKHTFGGRAIGTPSAPYEEPRALNEWEGAVDGARQFWDTIESEKGLPGKKLKNLEEKFKILFKDDKSKTEFRYTWKLIIHTLRLDYASSYEQYVTAENFRQMLAFFGPPTAEENGCIKTAGRLRQKSQRLKKDTREKQSWFAGVMSQDDAARVLENEAQGCFLVRFSTSCAREGWYALAVKTQDAGVVHTQIEQSRVGNERRFNVHGHKVRFGTLWDLIEYYEVNQLILTDREEDGEAEGDSEEDEEFRVYLNSPCPGLPLNAICSGYKKGKKR